MHLAHWSIAKTKNRETEPSGLGWELFKNYLIGLEKYNPDYFLYENNKSMAPAIREQITKELGVEPILINSALVSAQNRQRLYWTNIPGVTQPEDRGILLRDILDCETAHNTRLYNLDSLYRADAVSEDGKSPVRIGTIESGTATRHDSKPFRVYSPYGKSVTLQGEAGGQGAKTGLYAVPLTQTEEKALSKLVEKYGYLPEMFNAYNLSEIIDKSPTLSTGSMRTSSCAVSIIEAADGKTCPIYEVLDGLITIKDEQYPIKLPDGYYIIRQLTVTECKRLQAVPDNYIFPVSNTQAYKMLGNSWTVEVIKHILSFIPKLSESEVEVLSMYDGMSAGMIALKGLGVPVRSYHASEIDKYCIKTVAHNFPEIIQIGDAFQVRDDGWSVERSNR